MMDDEGGAEDGESGFDDYLFYDAISWWDVIWGVG